LALVVRQYRLQSEETTATIAFLQLLPRPLEVLAAGLELLVALEIAEARAAVALMAGLVALEPQIKELLDGRPLHKAAEVVVVLVKLQQAEMEGTDLPHQSQGHR
jgi:hypothetical protein